VLWGKEDRLMPAAAAEQWRGLLANARAQLVGQAGHFPALEQPEGSAGAVLRLMGIA
jgi:pimeloyl-ACP methyl ester carboxylesterase